MQATLSMLASPSQAWLQGCVMRPWDMAELSQLDIWQGVHAHV